MLKRMNDALAYIESHLHDEIDYTELEKITGTSLYHFRRIFSFISGMSLGEYIRKRKLSNAMFDLLHEGMSVTEASFKYGYESVEGFSRAFQTWSGIKPSEVKSENTLKSFPKLSFKLTVQGGLNMDFAIVEKPRFKIIGVKQRVSIQFSGESNEL